MYLCLGDIYIYVYISDLMCTQALPGQHCNYVCTFSILLALIIIIIIIIIIGNLPHLFQIELLTLSHQTLTEQCRHALVDYPQEKILHFS